MTQKKIPDADILIGNLEMTRVQLAEAVLGEEDTSLLVDKLNEGMATLHQMIANNMISPEKVSSFGPLVSSLLSTLTEHKAKLDSTVAGDPLNEDRKRTEVAESKALSQEKDALLASLRVLQTAEANLSREKPVVAASLLEDDSMVCTSLDQLIRNKPQTRFGDLPSGTAVLVNNRYWVRARGQAVDSESQGGVGPEENE